MEFIVALLQSRFKHHLICNEWFLSAFWVCQLLDVPYTSQHRLTRTIVECLTTLDFESLSKREHSDRSLDFWKKFLAIFQKEVKNENEMISIASFVSQDMTSLVHFRVKIIRSIFFVTLMALESKPSCEKQIFSPSCFIEIVYQKLVNSITHLNNACPSTLLADIDPQFQTESFSTRGLSDDEKLNQHGNQNGFLITIMLDFLKTIAKFCREEHFELLRLNCMQLFIPNITLVHRKSLSCITNDCVCEFRESLASSGDLSPLSPLSLISLSFSFYCFFKYKLKFALNKHLI